MKVTSAFIQIRCSNLMSIAETSRLQSDAVSLYLKPGQFRVYAAEAHSSKVSVVVWDGQQNIFEMLELWHAETRPLGSAWKPGLYLVSVGAQDKTTMYRVVKSHE